MAATVECGDYWKKKMRHLFNRIDVGGQGRIKKGDMLGVAESFIEVDQLQKEEADKLRALFDSGVWDHFFEAKSGEADGACTDNIMISNIVEQGKNSFLQVASYLFGRYFDAVDKDKDARIRLPEYIRYFYIIGVAEKYAEPAFHALDSDKDGVITREEFIKAGSDFIGLEKQSLPGDYMFGPF